MLQALQFDTDPIPDSVLRSMFAARKSVFVDLLKWDVAVIDGAYEVDQFDDPHARYLVLGDTDGRHLGSARLLPTLRPHILGDLYPQLCEASPPTGADIYEITRFCLDRRLRAAERRLVRDTLVTALAHFALTHGIRSYSAIADIAWLQQILAFGWRCRPLGLPVMQDGKMLGALRIEIDAQTPQLLAEAGIAAIPALRGEAARIAA
ncbi:acyl-homoserine-lactone synthase [Sphingomonas immobilis]|uniref:Acyl-homoserine-lactone synthase n=1 Tax=Sphingomonas immobilis TaxID=3063997 RepID=A0ABT9A2C4_9SPHN|nr:acyl-homoserine-lactone synthase [Sphingomonas sp. CA1-15]MDO7843587.1 acyl-homoserine-lactone synthase [Sphingomonas sp. CA1-15]